ncbi:MAG: transposase [Synergistaceae bacterium]|nr:transposase [Synergistaceae bacterium]
MTLAVLSTGECVVGPKAHKVLLQRLRHASRDFCGKICSCCGEKLGELPLSVREWTCPQCGARHDGDVNAAVKLRNYAVSSMVSAWCQPGVSLWRGKLWPSSRDGREMVAR